MQRLIKSKPFLTLIICTSTRRKFRYLLITSGRSCTSSPQKNIRKNKELGFYTSIKVLNNEQSRADMQRLSGQYLNGNEIKIQLVDSVAAMNKYAQVLVMICQFPEFSGY